MVCTTGHAPCGGLKAGLWKSNVANKLTFPIVAFYLTVGALLPDLWLAVLVAWLCMGANMALSYLLARLLSQPLARLAKRGGYRIPTVNPLSG